MPNPIVRDGFEFLHDRFQTVLSHLERTSPDALRSMFFPRLTPGANKKLRDHRDYVKCQLKHYGVEYDESEFSGNGTKLLKKVLLAGKMDKVPDHIENLRLQMSTEWYDQLTLKEMAESYPDAIFKRHFLDASGKPDRAKTAGVLAVPIPSGSDYRKWRVIEAARKVSGLYHRFVPDTLYIGWDRAAVESEISGHADRMEREREEEERQMREEQDAREQERKEMHADYLRKAQRDKGKKAWSPVGEYTVHCAALEDGWSDTEDLSLTLCETEKPGIFQADFDFGVVEGTMILCDQKPVLNQYCADLEREDDEELEDDWDDDENADYDSEEEDRPAAGAKRKAPAVPPRGRGRPPKKAKGSPTQPLEFFLKWKGMETGEGEIFCDAAEGFIKFDDSKYASFTGEMDISFVGSGVSFTARKVSRTARDSGSGSGRSWSDYSFSAYEGARVSRWH